MTDTSAMPITIPTEPIGSVPTPFDLLRKLTEVDCDDPAYVPFFEAAIRDTIYRFEATGSPVITYGEQRQYHNFWTYCVHGLSNTASDGFKIPFADGHTRRMLRLTRGLFRYSRYADLYRMSRCATLTCPSSRPHITFGVKSDVPSRTSRIIRNEQFIEDLLRQHETEIRRRLQKGAHKVQIDFTEARLAMRSIHPAAP